MDEQTTRILIRSLLGQFKSRFDVIDGYLQNKPNLLDSEFKNKLILLEQTIDNLYEFIEVPRQV